MKRRSRWLIFVSLMLSFALVVAACGDDDDAATTTAAPETTTTTEATTTTAEATTTTAEATTTTAEEETTTTGAEEPEILFDIGVTEEPCPDSPNPDNGCIYLGVISDLSDGPFAPVAIPLTQAEEDFWKLVNADGGLNGYDVTITAETTIDAHYDPQQHVEGFVQIEPRIAVLAQTLGTPQSQAALPRYDEGDVVAVPATWWSGWSFPDFDQGLIMEAGANYCAESMNAFDFVVQAKQGEEFTYAIVAFPGDYGGDYAAGVKIAAGANGLGDPVADVLQIPISAGGDVAEAVATLVGTTPDVVFIATGPTEMAQIVAGTFQGGHQTAMYVGIGPSWNTALLGQEALLPLLEAAFFHSSPWAGWSADTEGHAAMRAAAEQFGRTPNIGYTAGWVFQYNIKALLEKAIENGDLTRAGLRAAVQELDEVDYAGMLPPKSFVGDPNDIIVRQSLVNQIDPSEPDGLSQATPFFAGPTVTAYTFDSPCFSG